MNPEAPYNQLPLLPPETSLEGRNIQRMTVEAHKALAELKGSGPMVPNQVLLLQLIGLKEAQLSSEVENIVTTNDQLYRAFADRISAIDLQTKEVLRYKDALWYGFDAITKQNRLLNTPLFEEIAAKILGQDRGIRKLPGTKLTGPKGKVVYTPPEGEELIRDKLSNLEHFLNNDSDEIDDLAKLAILHYQFEAIHPFYDGNGRTGRILNILFLIEKGLLEYPILYHSQYIIENKSRYYELLNGVTRDQDWESWVLFILEALAKTAKETRKRLLEIHSVMEETRVKIRKNLPKIFSEELVELLFFHPYCKIKFLVEQGVASRQTASLYLKQLAEIGILETVKNGRELYFLNRPFIDVLTK